jgi:hypothetical protein
MNEHAENIDELSGFMEQLDLNRDPPYQGLTQEEQQHQKQQLENHMMIRCHQLEQTWQFGDYF